jgi:transcriptional regulator with XRE-family HTH domain
MSKETAIERYVIEKVKEFRIDRRISQAELARRLDVSEGFIGNIENPKYPEKYNIRLLNEVAKALDCSPKDFWPDAAL